MHLARRARSFGGPSATCWRAGLKSAWLALRYDAMRDRTSAGDAREHVRQQGEMMDRVTVL